MHWLRTTHYTDIVTSPFHKCETIRKSNMNVQCLRRQTDYNVILIQIKVRPNNVLFYSKCTQHLNVLATESNNKKIIVKCHRRLLKHNNDYVSGEMLNTVRSLSRNLVS